MFITFYTCIHSHKHGTRITYSTCTGTRVLNSFLLRQYKNNRARTKLIENCSSKPEHQRVIISRSSGHQLFTYSKEQRFTFTTKQPARLCIVKWSPNRLKLTWRVQCFQLLQSTTVSFSFIQKKHEWKHHSCVYNTTHCNWKRRAEHPTTRFTST